MVPSFKFGSHDSDHAHFRGQFAVRWLVHVIFTVCTKYEVSIFHHSEYVKAVPKFRNWSCDLSLAGPMVFLPATMCFMCFISVQNMVLLALSVQMLCWGSLIINLGHVTLTTPTLGVICHLTAHTSCGEYAYQRRTLYVKRFHRYWGFPKYPYLLTKFALLMRGITWYISSRWNQIPYLAFPFPVQYTTFTKLSLTKRGVSIETPLTPT